MSVRLVVKISCCGIIEKVKFVERRAGKNKVIHLFAFIFFALSTVFFTVKAESLLKDWDIFWDIYKFRDI